MFIMIFSLSLLSVKYFKFWYKCIEQELVLEKNLIKIDYLFD